MQTRCLAFVEDAYEESNHVEIFGGSSAQESADEYGAAQNRGEPPIGAFVFYACAGPVGDEIKNWGHVGLCIGEGKVIHAWDTVRIDRLSRRAEPHPCSRLDAATVYRLGADRADFCGLSQKLKPGLSACHRVWKQSADCQIEHTCNHR